MIIIKREYNQILGPCKTKKNLFNLNVTVILIVVDALETVCRKIAVTQTDS